MVGRSREPRGSARLDRTFPYAPLRCRPGSRMAGSCWSDVGPRSNDGRGSVPGASAVEVIDETIPYWRLPPEAYCGRAPSSGRGARRPAVETLAQIRIETRLLDAATSASNSGARLYGHVRQARPRGVWCLRGFADTN